ncbi:Zinc finger RING-type [Arabidopsis thaliana x Arabidopsis arenosa]|uniref:RING-type E3 ubiquitin transferase n=1 Tax=Arabidopsis thaliana x Arabidopsis arenosa TaxID=1240361 RepID=A0A8T1YDY6_9BRAS|nr:Zinc finger RING-type [Arabidopsis thaliana x Arabidopsis arenosa]
MFLFMLPLIMAIVVIVTYFDRICIEPIQQPPTEIALETHQNSHPPPQSQPLPQPLPQQDIETGHLAPLQSQLEYKTGYRAQVEEMEFKDIEKEGFDEICCSICLEELEDGHEIIRIKKCKHVFHHYQVTQIASHVC